MVPRDRIAEGQLAPDEEEMRATSALQEEAAPNAEPGATGEVGTRRWPEGQPTGKEFTGDTS